MFTERNGIYIIDLQKTVKMVNVAYNFVRDIAAEGGTVLFVGTKKQAQDSVQEEATRAGMFYVNQRWLGGTLTNFKTIRKRINRLKDIDRKSTRLNSSHVAISYAVFCLKKKKQIILI